MDKSVTITTFPIWKNAGPSTIDKPAIEQETRPEEDLDLPWQVVVHNDPVNLMSYVSYVFQTYFGYDEAKASQLMLQVHHEGRSAVSTGTRETMEVDVQAMHSYGLWATVQPDSVK